MQYRQFTLHFFLKSLQVNGYNSIIWFASLFLVLLLPSVRIRCNLTTYWRIHLIYVIARVNSQNPRELCFLIAVNCLWGTVYKAPNEGIIYVLHWHILTGRFLMHSSPKHAYFVSVFIFSTRPAQIWWAHKIFIIVHHWLRHFCDIISQIVCTPVQSLNQWCHRSDVTKTCGGCISRTKCRRQARPMSFKSAHCVQHISVRF